MKSTSLRPAEYYALLALFDQNLNKYALTGCIYNLSLKGVALDNTQITRLITKLEGAALIELALVEKLANGRQKYAYGITEHGKILLQEEILRLNETPPDIQRMLLSTHT